VGGRRFGATLPRPRVELAPRLRELPCGAFDGARWADLATGALAEAAAHGRADRQRPTRANERGTPAGTVRPRPQRLALPPRRRAAVPQLRSLLALASLLPLTACGAPSAGAPVALVAACPDTPALPAGLALDPFYAKYCVADGVAIVASDEVPDAALQRARDLVGAMLAPVRADAVAAIHDARVRVGVIGVDQVTTDLPEHADLNEAFPLPDGDWDTRTRGVAATQARPLTSAAEENLLCAPGDVYAGESILVHEFAHTVHEQGVAVVDASFDGRLRTAYQEAVEAGLWTDTYAATNAIEYWAEGVQSHFDVNGSADPADGVHNAIASRDALQSHDPALYALVDEVFGGTAALDLCP
jgi:hypothetical protein